MKATARQLGCALVLNALTGPVFADAIANALPLIETRPVQVTAATGEAATVSIPRSALTSMNGIPGVFVIENNQARFRTVRPGKAGADRVQILSGLFGNETLVSGELDAVHDGSPIRIVTPAEK